MLYVTTHPETSSVTASDLDGVGSATAAAIRQMFASTLATTADSAVAEATNAIAAG